MENIKQKFREGFKAYWGNALYITVFFSVFTNYRRIILAHYDISYEHYGVSLIKGLVLAKIILIAEHLRIGQGLEDKPLAIPTLYKSFLFTLCAVILGAIELMVRAFLRAGDPASIADAFIGGFSYEWFAGTMIIFVMFIPFFGIRELGRVLGKGKISALFLKNRPKNP
ncbi:MAG: hypothetical protein WC478_05350 [Candidatus Omnitrophota bacterium]